MQKDSDEIIPDSNTANVIKDNMEYLDNLSKKGLDIDNKRILYTSLIIGVLYLIISSSFTDNLVSFYINNKYLRHVVMSLLFTIIVIVVLKIRHNA